MFLVLYAESLLLVLRMIRDRYSGTHLLWILYIVVSLDVIPLAERVSQPVSKYKDVFDAIIGNPVTMRATYNCTFSNLSMSYWLQPSQTTEAYSRIGLTKVIYILERLLFPRLNLSFFKRPFFLVLCLL